MALEDRVGGIELWSRRRIAAFDLPQQIDRSPDALERGSQPRNVGPVRGRIGPSGIRISDDLAHDCAQRQIFGHRGKCQKRRKYVPGNAFCRLRRHDLAVVAGRNGD